MLRRWYDESGVEKAGMDNAGNFYLSGTVTSNTTTANFHLGPTSKTWSISVGGQKKLALLLGGNFGDSTGDLFMTGEPQDSPQNGHPYRIKIGDTLKFSVDDAGNMYFANGVDALQAGAYRPDYDYDNVSPFLPNLEDGSTDANGVTLAMLQIISNYVLFGLLPDSASEFLLIENYLGDNNNVYNYYNGYVGSYPAHKITNSSPPSFDYTDNNSRKWEPSLIARLCFAGHLMKDYWLDEETLEAFYRLLEIRARPICTEAIWLKGEVVSPFSTGGRVYGNIPLRQVAAFTLAGLMLHDLPDLPEGVGNGQTYDFYEENAESTGALLLCAGMDQLVRSVEWADWRKCYSSDGVYSEGPGYAAYITDISVALLWFLEQYPIDYDKIDDATNLPGGEDGDSLRADVTAWKAYMEDHIKWFLDTQRPDGRWFAVDDSGVLDNVGALRLLYQVYKDKPRLQNRIRYTLSAQGEPWDASTEPGVIDRHYWLHAVLGSVPPYPLRGNTAPTENEAITYRVYPKGGHLYTQTANTTSTRNGYTSNSLMGVFINAGSWQWNNRYSYSYATLDGVKTKTWGDNTTDTVTIPDEILTSSVLKACQIGNIAGLDEDVVARPLRSEALEIQHKRAVDGHFELFGYGYPLLIGPGLMHYNEAFNMTRVADGGASFRDDGDGDKPINHHNYAYPYFDSNGNPDGTRYAYWPYNEWAHPDAHNLMQVYDSADGAYYYPKGFHWDGDAFTSRTQHLGSVSNSGEAYAEVFQMRYLDNQERTIIWAHERYWVVIDQVRTSFTLSGNQFNEGDISMGTFKTRFHGRGFLSNLSSRSVNSDPFIWQIGERKANRNFTNLTYNDFDSRQDNLQLLLYCNLVDSTASFSVDHEGRHSSAGSLNDVVEELENHNAWYHDVLEIESIGGDQYGMVSIFWPQNKDLTGGSFAEPDVSWDGTYPTITIDVTYNGESLDIDDSWNLNLSQFIRSAGDVTP